MSIVCGTDFSALAWEAVTAAAAIAARARDTLWLVSVLDEPSAKDLGPEGRDRLERGVLQRLEAEADRIRPRVRRCEVAVLFGHAAAQLKAFAEEKHASLLVVASAGHSRRPLVRLGGTSERTASGATPPVLVVREAAPFEAWGKGERALKVLVGADDTPATDSAVRWVNGLRAIGPVDLVVGHVYYGDEAHLRYGLNRSLSYTDRNPELEVLIERDLRRRFTLVPGAGETFYRAKLGIGRLADHLIELAGAEGADLVVVGTHGKKGLVRLGSVSSGTLHHAKMAVALVPWDGRPRLASQPAPALKRVLVATDFTLLGNAALPWACAVAPPDAEVVLAHVTQTNGIAGSLLELYLPGTTIGDQPPARVVAEVTQRLLDLAVRAPSRATPTRVVVQRGPDVARAICEAAAREAADVIVIGSHGRSGVRRAALGSVAEGVLRHAPCPVFVVPGKE